MLWIFLVLALGFPLSLAIRSHPLQHDANPFVPPPLESIIPAEPTRLESGAVYMLLDQHCEEHHRRPVFSPRISVYQKLEGDLSQLALPMGGPYSCQSDDGNFLYVHWIQWTEVSAPQTTLTLRRVFFQDRNPRNGGWLRSFWRSWTRTVTQQVATIRLDVANAAQEFTFSRYTDFLHKLAQQQRETEKETLAQGKLFQQTFCLRDQAMLEFLRNAGLSVPSTNGQLLISYLSFQASTLITTHSARSLWMRKYSHAMLPEGAKNVHFELTVRTQMPTWTLLRQRKHTFTVRTGEIQCKGKDQFRISVFDHAVLQWEELLKQMRPFSFPVPFLDTNTYLGVHFELTAVHMAALGQYVRAIESMATPALSPLLNSVDSFGFTPLHFAVYTQNRETVLHLLRGGALVNALSDYGLSPLSIACMTGQLEMVQLLLSFEANVAHPPPSGNAVIVRPPLDGEPFETLDFRDRSPLHIAAEAGHLEVVRILLERGAVLEAATNWEQTPLHRASKAGHLSVVRLLLDHGANANAKDINQQTPLHLAAERNHLEVVALLLSRSAEIDAPDIHRCTPLHLAAEQGHTGAALMLLKNGAEIEARTGNFGRTPVLCAAFSGSLPALRTMVTYGADLQARDCSQRTVFQLAANKGGKALFEFLMEKGFTVNCPDTPVHFAAEIGNTDALRFLLDRGVGRNVLNSRSGFLQQTALQKAAHSGKLASVRLLVDAGAEVDVEDVQGNTLLHYACAKGGADLLEFLMDALQVDGNQGNGVGVYPIHVAAGYDNLAAVRTLVSRGVSLTQKDANGQAPLHIATRRGSLAMVKLLISLGADLTQTEDRHEQTAFEVASTGRRQITRIERLPEVEYAELLRILVPPGLQYRRDPLQLMASWDRPPSVAESNSYRLNSV